MDVLIIALLILINGFFALSEIALVSSKRSRLEQLRNEGRKGASSALKLLDNSEGFLSAIQVGITLIGIINGVYGGINIADDITPFFQKFTALANYAEEIALTITVLTITYFSIVVGELVPKTIALSNPERIAVRIASPIAWLSLIFFPFVKFLSFSTSLINRLLGIRKQPDSMTESELRQMLKSASHEGVIEKNQNLMHQKVFYFSDKKARHIMTHRLEIEWIDISKPANFIRDGILKSRHSRLICSRSTLDSFQGVLNVRDFLAADLASKDFSISKLLIQPVIVPETADAYKVLDLFKQKQVYFCVVVNEYGGIEGIITLHDILENLIGDIPEEGESSEPDVFLRDDKSWLVSGDAPVEILDGIFDNYMTDFESIEYTTVAGFVLDNIHKIPQIGDRFVYDNYMIEIVDIDDNRIDKILITKQ
ncbi:MAG: hemolysin family protein [Bacteroidales bacterium]|jgi:putative hemolysin|nr:hemolysin family protein [Bacteroidales bacterium]